MEIHGDWITLRNGHRIWYKIAGGGSGLPLLVLHGGPGTGHDYLENLDKLADARPVIFYDQLGCGRSDKPDDDRLWHIARCADEVAEVRELLGLHALHIIGQSYGGWLLLEYMSGQPKGIASIVLASTSSSLPEFSAETAVLIAQLPKQHQQAIKVHGNKGDYQHTDYQAAVEAFNHAFLCRIDPWPDCIMRTGANIAASKSSPVMNGPNDFTVIGNLKDWDRSVETRDIKLPTLITCGEFDAVSPACAVTLKKAIPHAELRLFKGCSHVPHLEDEVNYMNIIEQFLQAHDV